MPADSQKSAGSGPLPVRSRHKFLIWLILVFLATGVCTVLAAQSVLPEQSGRVVLYFFWGEGCPHCAQEEKYLEKLGHAYPRLEVRSYEVWHNRANAAFLSRMLKASGFRSSGVPVTFIDTKVFAGFTEKTAIQIEQKLRECMRNEEPCKDPSELRRPFLPDNAPGTVSVPLFGDVDLGRISLPLITVILGGMDSFNPCAFFVLFFLLSLLVHAGSRKRMLLIGGTFVFFSGFVYFIFMAAWLNLFMVAGRLTVITTVAGAVALFVAVVNIKDFFFFTKGISLSIPAQAKPKLFERMRDLLKATSVWSMLAGTVVLAIAANSYELLCTAGFPMVFTRVLTLQRLTISQYYLYLALYNCVYVLPLTVIVLIFTATLGSRKLSQWQGRKLKLLSGLMMFSLGLILLIDPALLNNIFVAAGMLVIVLLVFGGIVLIAGKYYQGMKKIQGL